MAQKKTSNLKIVQQQTETEAEARRERDAAYEKRQEEEMNWRLTQPEITARARQVRVTLEMYRTRLEGMPFDVVTGEIPRSVDYIDTPDPYEIAEAFDPCIEGHYKRLEAVIDNDDLLGLKWKTAETAFQIGVLAGAYFPAPRIARSIGSSVVWFTPLYRAAGVLRKGSEP